MYWDISLHIDNGRDPGPLANPAHYLILVGLYGVLVAGVLSIGAGRHGAPEQDGRSTSAAAGGRPSAALMIAACGAFALARLPARRHLAPAVRPGRDALGPDPPDADRRRARSRRSARMALMGEAITAVGRDPEREATPLRATTCAARCSWAASWSRCRPSRASSTSACRSSARCYQPILIMLAAGIGLVTARALPRPRRRAAGRGRLPRDPRLPGAHGRRRLGPDHAALPALHRRGAARRGGLRCAPAAAARSLNGAHRRRR